MSERRLTAAIAGVLALLTLAVHDVGYMLRQPYWLDEGWVAVSTRVPFGKLDDVTAVTPIGWTVLLRAVVVGGDQRQRLLPLLFAALTVVVAVWFGREVFARQAGRILGATLAGGAALLAPTALVRDDLKQYTADAFVAVLLFWLVARLDVEWSRRRLVTPAAVSAGGLLISHTSVFVGSAALLSVAAVQLLRRRWSRLLETCMVGAAAVVAMAVLYAVFDRPHVVSNLRGYWAAYYLPWRDGWHAMWSFFRLRVEVLDFAGLGPPLLCLALVAVGLAVLVRLQRYATALALPLLAIELIGASAAKRYPLLDLRTSHFLLTLLAVVAAVGATGLALWAARLHVAAGAVVAMTAAGLFVWQASPHFRDHPIDNEDVRSQVRYVEGHQRPGDVIVVDFGANYGFGYYYRDRAPEIRRVTTTATTFVVAYPDDSRIIVMSGREPADVRTAFGRAVLEAADGQSRIWIVRTHMQEPEQSAWRSVLAGTDSQELNVGAQPLVVVQPSEG